MDHKKSLELYEKMAKVLTSHDKRQLFVKLFMPFILTKINLEGSPDNTCWAIIDMVEKQRMYVQLHEGVCKLFPGENFDYILQ